MNVEQNVWISIQNNWVKATLIDNNIIYNDQELKNITTYKCNTDEIDNQNNLIDIPHLNEPTVLNSVYLRYIQNNIYTYTGNILISINPFQNLQLYTDKIIESYKNNQNKDPHIYQIARKSYNNLKNTHQNQTILISGESGAGKTYTARSIMKYLTKINNNQSTIEQKLIQSNPILEAFGNAKTLRNSNSSRFGKFIKIQFDKHLMSGCKIDSYLLEKIRVVNQTDNERNFHIFYQLLLSDIKNKYFLSDFSEYKYLNNVYIKCDDIDDNLEWNKTLNAMHVMNFSQEQIDYIFKILSSILHIGNLDIKSDEIDSNINIISQLLNIDTNILIDSIYHKYLTVSNETYKIDLDYEKKIISQKSLSMELYDRLFKSIVKHINQNMKSDSKHFIAILDIFGFESFDTNSFEQFCINYTNEKLQQQFNKYIFQLEQIEYENEGIDWTHISFPDNKKCLEIIENKFGLIDLLNEECRLPKGNDKNFTNKLLNAYKKSEYISQNKKFADTRFQINHYAGYVEYTATGFYDKNKNIISNEINNVIDNINIFSNEIKKSSKTVIIEFKNQLKKLISEIDDTNPFYVRCIKPNDQNISNNFDRIRVNEQLKYSGILEAIRVARAGYPIRFLKSDFVNKYNIVSRWNNLTDITNELMISNFCIGKTKIFLKNDAYNKLEDIRNNCIENFVIIIQKNARRYIQQNKYGKIVNKIIKIQTFIRIFLCKRKLDRLRKISSSIIIQKNSRRFIQQNSYRKILFNIKNIQKLYRKKIFKMQYNSSIKIQKWYRKKLLDKKQKRKIKAVIYIQKYYKRYYKNKQKLVNKNKKMSEKINNLERINHERKNYIYQISNEKKKLEKEKRDSIKKCENLENENQMFKQSIDHNIHQKIQLAQTVEQLLLENDRMRRQMEYINRRNNQKKDCVIC